MRRHYLKQLAKSIALTLAILFAPATPAGAQAPAPAFVAEPAIPAVVRLQLEVSINGTPTGMIGDFVDLGDGHFGCAAKELRELGLKPPAGAKPNDVVPLDRIANLAYVFDEQTQAISLITTDRNRITRRYDARGKREALKLRPSDYGAVFNYDVYAATGGGASSAGYGSRAFSGINASLDARLMAPMGVLDQTAIVGMTLADQTDLLRLNTTYTFANDRQLVTYRAGDFISGGVGWSTPVRLGGAQVQRTFSMRPDLVTTPMPAVSGSAAVPSTVDVFVNGTKSYSQDVAAGPFQINNIPSISGSGVAQVVTRDASGKEDVQSLSFYTSPHLLRPGLYDFSAEAGLPRKSFGIESFDYDNTIVASASLRTGITDWLTAEAHGEGGGGLVNGGVGAVASISNLGVVSAAVSASSSDQGTGVQLYGSFDTKIGLVSVHARSQHSFADYDDLATLTARKDTGRFGSQTEFLPGSVNNILSFAPPRAIDALTLSMPIAFDKSSISATYLRYQPQTGATSEIVSATYSRPLIYDASMFATGYADLNDTESMGVYVGVSVPLDGNISVSTGLNARADKISGSADVSKPVTQETGSFGWRVHDHEGDGTDRSATVGYRMAAARVEAGVHQGDDGVSGRGEIEGAVAILGGDIYTSNRIDDSFAVVDAHTPGVKVQRENAFVGETNEDGKILIPSLNSYQKNKISIDPMGLPLNAEIESTVDYVTPGYKSGVYVDFKVKKATPSALVILQDANGVFLAAGAEGRLDGSDEPFIVGYDGQAFIRNLRAVNTIHVVADGRTCTAQFSFSATDNTQPTIGPEICQ